MRSLYVFFIAVFLALPAQSLAGKPVLLIDQGHGQQFLIEKEGALDLSKLARVFRDEGFEVRALTGKVTPKDLSGVDAFVTSGLFVPYDNDERKEILGFIERGGAMSMMIHIAPTYGVLLKELGIASFTAPVKETQGNINDSPIDFRVAVFNGHPLTEGLKGFGLYGGWGLFPSSKSSLTPVATTSKNAWLDINNNQVRDANEAYRAFTMVFAGTKGKGRYAIFGDDAIFQNRFMDPDNSKLAKNLALWLSPPKAL
ncbi:DUF4350 domain-containing protein [bacterium]|nr:MAG: DUF4350 domain-containing protein [bacterium]